MDFITGHIGWIEVVCGPMFSGKSEELVRRLRRAGGAAVGGEGICRLTGGAAGELAPQLERPLRQVDNLALEGLARYSRTI